MAHDALTHPDHPLRVQGEDGIILTMGMLFALSDSYGAPKACCKGLSLQGNLGFYFRRLKSITCDTGSTLWG
jgi:hypothetical protein